jgi:hypothetical protein
MLWIFMTLVHELDEMALVSVTAKTCSAVVFCTGESYGLCHLLALLDYNLFDRLCLFVEVDPGRAASVG